MRSCKHYVGIKEGVEICLAFPNGIPDEIRFSGLDHSRPVREEGTLPDGTYLPDEVGGLLYEKDETMPNLAHTPPDPINN